MEHRRIESPQSFDVDGVTRLDVRLVAGRVDVVGTDDDAVSGRAHVEITSCAGPLEVDVVDGVLRIAHEKLTWNGLFEWVGGLRRARAVVAVTVPRGCAVRVGLVSADAVVSGITADETDVRSISGDVTLDGVSSRIVARTVSGALESRHLDGDLRFTTVSGDLTVAGSRVGSVHAESVSGDVTLDLELHLDDVRSAGVEVSTVSGDLTLRFPAAVGLTVDVRSTSGHLDSGFDGLETRRKPGSATMVGRIGSGAGVLRAKTVSGDVAIIPRVPA